MEELSFAEYLRKEMGLNDYQISKVQELLASFEQTEDMSAATDGVEICPKCGTAHPKVVRSGFAGSGKQMFRCTSCGRRFTYGSGRLTWYSHQNVDQWKTLILDTFSGQSLRSTSGKIGVNMETAFNMRHRLMCVLEKVLDDEVLFGKVELDETYVDSSRKGVGCGRDAGFGTGRPEGEAWAVQAEGVHPVRSRRRRTFLRPRLQLRISQPRHHIEAFLQSGTRQQRHHRRNCRL